MFLVRKANYIFTVIIVQSRRLGGSAVLSLLFQIIEILLFQIIEI